MFIFQIMLQDERRPLAHIPQSTPGAGLRTGSWGHSAALLGARVRFRSVRVFFGLVLFVCRFWFGVSLFSFFSLGLFFVGFGLLVFFPFDLSFECFFGLFCFVCGFVACFVKEQKGSDTFQTRARMD